MPTNNSNCSNEQPTEEYDRRKELEEFDNTKLGVKGLVDSGITRIPRIFHHPPDSLFEPLQDDGQSLIPVIDMSVVHQEVVERVRDAAAKLGFFQVINHGMSDSFLNCLMDAVKAFHELPAEQKMCLYRRDTATAGTGVGFSSNFDLFHSKAATWRDTLAVRLGPVPVDPNDVPQVCRDEVIEWGREVQQLAERIMGMLSQGLGLSADRLNGMPYIGRAGTTGHYYPYCPEPYKTMGVSSHTDPGMLTVLLQDQVGGLQVKYDGKWIDLRPVHGALVVNIGDLLQIISNDAYESGEHRVLANPFHTARVSISSFFSPGTTESLYGPLPELLSQGNPAVYQQFTFSDYLKKFLSKELAVRSTANCFRL